MKVAITRNLETFLRCRSTSVRDLQTRPDVGSLLAIFRLRPGMGRHLRILSATVLLACCMDLIAGSHAAAQGVKIPDRLWECETHNKTTCGTWTFSGSDGTGQWPNGAVANLTVQQFDSAWVIIRRSDSSGSSAGLVATYSGKLKGDRIKGQVTWTWIGHWNQPVQGTWYATLREPTAVAPAPRPQPDAPQVSQQVTLASPTANSKPPASAEGGGSAALRPRPGTDTDAIVQRADQLYDKRDYAGALPFYLQAAAAGQAHALMRVGFCYDLGFGVESDPAAALRWYQKAVAAGDLEAMAYLGGLYAEGSGVPTDYVLPITKIRRNTTNRSRRAARSTSSGVVAASSGRIAAKLGDDYVVGAAEDPNAGMQYGARRTPGRQGLPGGVLAQERLAVNPDPSALVERHRSMPSARTWLGARRDAGGRAP